MPLRTASPLRAVLMLGLLGLGLVAAGPACTLMVGDSPNQCGSQGDCAAFAGAVCQGGLCVTPSSGVGGSGGTSGSGGSGGALTCSSNQDCAIISGTYSVCDPASSQCVNLLSDDCTTIAGNYQSDDSVIAGALFPLTGAQASQGAIWEKALRRAVADFDGIVGGLPPSGGAGAKRPLVFLICDSAKDPARAARFLTETVGAKVVVGAPPASVGSELEAAGASFVRVARAVAPISQGSRISLVPPAATEARALAKVANDVLLPYLKSQVNDNPLRVRVVGSQSNFSEAVGEAFEPLVELPTVAVEESSYSVPGSVPITQFQSELATVITQISIAAPHLIVLTGGAEAAGPLVAGIELNWPAATPHRPTYLVGSWAKSPEMLGHRESFSLKGRLLGVDPGEPAATREEYAKFLVGYQQGFNDGSDPRTSGTSQVYDSVFLTAYGYASQVAVSDISQVNQAMTALLLPSMAPRVFVGVDHIAKSVSDLASGGPAKIIGISGDMELEGTTRNVYSTYRVWCTVDSGMDVNFADSAMVYDDGSSSLLGNLSAPCALQFAKTSN